MKFICFDTEDDSKDLMESGKSGFDKKVTQIAAITGEGKKYYNRGNVKDFIRWLNQQPEKYIYAHNLQYDLGNIFGDCLDKLDCVLVGGRLIKAVWGKKVFVDSFNIWPMSVKKLGDAFCLKKLETENMATDREYVFRDVEAMLFAWRFCETLGMDNLPPTLGGLCVKVWKTWGGENCHNSTELARDAYYGGRVELFKLQNETENVCYTDINSLYPFVMQKEYPGEIYLWEEKTLPKFGVAKITIEIPQTRLPVLPFRREIDGRIFFLWGKITGAWTIAEINAAIERGAKIKKVFECYGTNETTRPYGTFVNKLYNSRLAANSPAEKLFFKLLMNNLYGRLGSSGVIGRTVWNEPKNEKLAGIVFGQKKLVSYKMPLSAETNWIHAAYVTAYGRLELLKYLETIGADNLIYCDTDSCIFDCQEKKIPFPIGSDIGQMKLESWETNCQVWLPKMYRIGKSFKAKGVPQRLAKTFIETGKAEFALPFKMRESIRFYDRKNARRLSVWRNVVKENRSTYDRKKMIGKHFFPCNSSDLL